ncbi:IclR family transcriptional regulator [Brevibacterium sediminis]|uniref:IclR family transcriptional regulator n=1 Tax=Brevibacterium sediminis TaxID=1857024 RepID=UPI003B3A8BB6
MEVPVANSSSGESVIHRAVRILSVFGPRAQSRGLREIAREADLPVSTVHRILNELEVEGLVSRDQSGRWTLGNRLWEIASRGAEASDLRKAALPPMEDVVQALQVHISLSVLDGTDALYVERLAPDEFVVNITEVAGRLPAHACSAGLMLTAFGPTEQQELMLRRRLEKLTENTITDPHELRALFARIREQGYAAMEGIIVAESSGISVPVYGRGGEVIAALTVIRHRGQEDLNVIVPQLRFASRATSRRLGVVLDSHRVRRLMG